MKQYENDKIVNFVWFRENSSVETQLRSKSHYRVPW